MWLHERIGTKEFNQRKVVLYRAYIDGIAWMFNCESDIEIFFFFTLALNIKVFDQRFKRNNNSMLF